MCLGKKSSYDKKLDKNKVCLRINVIIDKKLKNNCIIQKFELQNKKSYNL